MSIEVRLRALPFLLLTLSACSDNEFTRASRTDEFDQAPSNQVDILWVIDNSVSMQNEQENVAAGAEDFIANLVPTDTPDVIDFHLGVITTDVSRANPNAGILLGTPNVLDIDTPGYADAFRARVVQGTSGSDQEAGLEAAIMAVSAPLSYGPNDGFIRDGAMLFIIVVSDENDCSDYGALGPNATGEQCYTRASELVPVTDLVRTLVDVKNGDQVVVSGIVGPEVLAGCDATVLGRRYYTAIDLLGGTKADICQTDYSAVMDSLGKTASGILSVFQLEKSAIEETIEVKVTPPGGTEAVVPADPENGWTYIADYAQIEFHGTSIPERGSHIEVSYDVAGSVQEEAPGDTASL